MTTIPLVAALIAIAFPGGLALSAFDYTAHRYDRPMWVLIPLAIALTVPAWAFLGGMGFINLSSLVTNDHTSVRLDLLLKPANLWLFLVITVTYGAAGLGIGRAMHSESARPRIERVFGKSIGASSWLDATGAALGGWVHIRTRTNRDFRGILASLPELAEGHIQLRSASIYDPEAQGWREFILDRVVISVSDIEHMTFAVESNQSSGGHDGREAKTTDDAVPQGRQSSRESELQPQPGAAPQGSHASPDPSSTSDAEVRPKEPEVNRVGEFKAIESSPTPPDVVKEDTIKG